MSYPKRTQYKYAKSPYRVSNWHAYDAGLRRRGDLTIWFSQDAIDAWTAPRRTRPGGQRLYADLAMALLHSSGLKDKAAFAGRRGMFDHEVSEAQPVQVREAEEVPRS